MATQSWSVSITLLSGICESGLRESERKFAFFWPHCEGRAQYFTQPSATDTNLTN